MSDSERRDSFYDGDEDVSYDDIGSERLSEIYDSERDSEDTLRTNESMGPPKSIPPEEMKLRKENKQLKATEKELREYNRKIILKNRALEEDIESLLEDMTKQNAKIDVLKMAQKRLQLEKKELQSTYDLLKARVSDLTGRKPIQGGNNKRIKNVSKRSTASHHHATRRHSSQRKKSGTLRRV